MLQNVRSLIIEYYKNICHDNWGYKTLCLYKSIKAKTVVNWYPWP